ncbi:MAG: hypothetical protein OEY07_20450 [Gammaproteobacteria bacterium]|nr:hypothetical protein [Gammaproteobacteria bacterium]
MLLSLGVCSANENSAELPKNKPTMVLVGTDTKDIRDFKIIGQIAAGQYVAETGGAELSLAIVNNKQHLDITRVCKEPGMNPEQKHYSLKNNNQSVISTKSISLVSLSDGILVLEDQPESDGISNEIWYYYRRK